MAVALKSRAKSRSKPRKSLSLEERLRRFAAFKGKFANLGGSSEEFAREKRAEIKREEAKHDLRAGRMHGNRNGKE